ncbi:MAG: endonuclease III [Bacillota bacterium]
MKKSSNKNYVVLEKLAAMYPGAATQLEYGSTFQLLVAVMLSAQCTDRQVNKITSELFKEFREPEDFAALGWEDLSEKIKGCGLYRNKSRNIVAASRMLAEKYRSGVPRDRDALEALPGVGRKTANVVMNIAFGMPVMPVDTHVFRVSRRLGLSAGKSPAAVEKDLEKIVPPELMGKIHHCLISHGRGICRARNPRCSRCGLIGFCPESGADHKGANNKAGG